MAFLRNNLFPQGFGQHVANNRDAYLLAGLGMLTGGNQQQQAQLATQGLIQGRKMAQARAQENMTRSFLEKHHPELAAQVRDGLPIKKAMSMISGSAGDKWSLNPELFRDQEGNYRYGTFSGAGDFKPIDTGGLTPVNPYEKSFERARGAASGKRMGEESYTAPEQVQKSLDTVRQIDELIASPGLGAIFGPLDQFRPSWTMGDQGRDALARYKQLQGKAFLEAYSMLKGGGQITEIEGIKAEAAMARLDRAQDVETAKLALKEFRDAVSEGARKLRERFDIGNTGGTQAPSAADPLGIR